MQYCSPFLSAKSTVIILAAGLVLSMFPVRAAAQNGLSVKVQPSTIELRVDPGDRETGELSITNENGGRQVYFIGTRNISSMDDSGSPIFSDVPADDPQTAAAWVKTNSDKVELEVGQTVSIPYTVTVPQDASPGSYFAAIFVTREADKVAESGAGVGFQVASLMSIRVNGVALESLALRAFSTDRSLYTEPTLTFSTKVENTGTVLERPVGIIVVSDMFNREVGKLVFNEVGGAIMPRADRVFTNTWTSDHFLVGRYTARISVAYGDTERKTETRDVSLWIIPVKEVGSALGAIVLMVLIIAMVVRGYVRRALARAGAPVTPRGAPSFVRRFIRTVLWLAILVVVAVGIFVVLSA